MATEDSTVSSADTPRLIRAIASRAGTAKELAREFGYSVAELRDFAALYHVQIAREKERQARYTTRERDENEELWIKSKEARLAKYQDIVDDLIESQSYDAVTLREIRSYMRYAAEELGQLLNRGAGMDGDEHPINYTIEGVDMDNLK